MSTENKVTRRRLIQRMVSCVAVLSLAGPILTACGSSSTPTPQVIEETARETVVPPEPTAVPPEPTGESSLRDFDMIARRWEFVPSTLTVRKGDTVRIRITSTDVPHGFGLPEFGINERVEPGRDVHIEFVLTPETWTHG